MRSKTEQIEHILRGETETWAHAQLGMGQTLADRQYSDFISVTPDEVVAHVLARGFDPRAVWTQKEHPSQRDNRIVIEPMGAKWATYYTERGSRDDERTFDREIDAVRDVVMRLLDSAWTALNVRYWHRHYPMLERLPDFGEPWPSRP